ncbi:MAG: VOC family protein [Tabrizicola sp.]
MNSLPFTLTLGAKDIDASGRFYDAVLATVGWGMHASWQGWRVYSEGGSGSGVILYICTPYDGQPATAGNGTMPGFSARTHAEVDAFHAAALANGGTDDGAPGPRPDYGPEWYAAYVRDPTGNKILCVCKSYVA